MKSKPFSPPILFTNIIHTPGSYLHPCRREQKILGIVEVNANILGHHLPLTWKGSLLDSVGPLIIETLTRHLPLAIEPVGPAVLKMVDNTKSIEHIEKMLIHHIPLEWNGQLLPKTWEEHQSIRATLSRHLPLSIEPVGPAVITIDGTTKSILALVQELTSVERVDKRYWWFDEINT